VEILVSEVEAGDVSRFPQPWPRGYCTSKIPDRQIRAHCDPSLIMTGCRGISYYFNLWRICWELIELLWIPPKRTFTLYGRNVVFEEAADILISSSTPCAMEADSGDS
jgi:hypothetical protein